MGFFSNLKGNLTGDWADVTLRVGEARRGETVPVGVDVAVKDKDIEVTRVIVELRCQEIVDLPNRSVNDSSHTPDTSETSTLHNEEVGLSGPVQLAGGARQSFEGQVRIPANMPPSVHGRYARFAWEVRARLEMKGNDPDSNWTSLQVD